MTERAIHIDQCVVRIRRASGWSWGANPDALVRAATRALPALLARQVPALLSVDGPGVVTVPELRLTIPIALEDLAGVGESDTLGSLHGPLARLDERLSAALAASIGAAAITADPQQQEPESSEPRTGTPGRSIASASPIAPIVTLLARWTAAGHLLDTIRRLSDPVAESWRRALERELAPVVREEASILADAATSEILERVASASLGPDQAWLAIVASLVGDPVRPGSVERSIEVASQHVAPGDLVASGATRVATSEGESLAERAMGRSEPEPAASATLIDPDRTSPSLGWHATDELEIACALPFLALFPLARAGWLAALDAAVTAAGARDVLPGLATALAYKLLAPPIRGWRRTSGASTAAAAFAGLAMAPPDSVLHRLSALDAHLAEPLEATVRTALVAGHTRGSPFVIQAAGDGYHLLDGEGLFALAWSARPHELATELDELVLVPAASASPELLDRLELANVRFVTDAPATRGEPWRELPGGLCTNDTHTPADQLTASARRLDELATLAGELDAELSRRPGLPLATTGVVERALTLGAALALGDLSWTLFREREVATPVLALHRFADLGATVTFGAEVVRVRLPLGRRHADLFAHRYTGEVHDVPWFDGRVVEICGG